MARKVEWPVAVSILLAITRIHAQNISRCELSENKMSSCNFGTLPGRWKHGDGHLGWDIFNPDCRLQDLLGATGSSYAGLSEREEQIGVLLFGGGILLKATAANLKGYFSKASGLFTRDPADSVDRTMVADTCADRMLWDRPDTFYSMGVESFCLCQ